MESEKKKGPNSKGNTSTKSSMELGSIPIGSMYGMFTYSYHKNKPNVTYGILLFPGFNSYVQKGTMWVTSEYRWFHKSREFRELDWHLGDTGNHL